PHDRRGRLTVLRHDEAIRAGRRRSAQPQEPPAPGAVPLAEPPGVARRGSLDMDPERETAANREAPGRELDVAQLHAHVLPFGGRSLVAGEVLRPDREDVRASGKRSPSNPS